MRKASLRLLVGSVSVAKLTELAYNDWFSNSSENILTRTLSLIDWAPKDITFAMTCSNRAYCSVVF